MTLLAVVLYLAILVGIGVVASRRTHDTRDYFAAGKSLGFWSVAFSARATGESAWLLLGLTGMGAAVGVQAFWVVLGEVLGVCGAWLLLARRFKRLTDRYDSITVPEYFESRFRDRTHAVRLVSAVALVVFVTIYVSAQIDATGTAFETFLGWSYHQGIFVGFAVVMAYIIAGGFLAVVWSDVFQGSLMFLGLVTIPVLGVIHAGGIEPVLEGLRAQDPALLGAFGPGGFGPGSIPAILGFALIGLGFLGSPQIFVRFIALRSEKELPRGAAVSFVWTLFADSGAVLTGMVGRHLLVPAGEGAETVLGSGAQNVLPEMVQLLLPAFLVGLMIAVVLAAIMSTVDSLLVVASSSYVRDYVQGVKRPDLPDAALLPLCRKATAVLALLALGVALTVAAVSPDRTIFWFVIFGWSGIAATFCPTMILSLFWPGMTARGALAAMVTGFLGVPLFKFAGPSLPLVGDFIAGTGELPPSFLLGGIAGVLVSLSDRSPAASDVRAAAAQELSAE